MTRPAVPSGPIAHATAITVVLARSHLRTDADVQRKRPSCELLENMHVHKSRGKPKARRSVSESKHHGQTNKR